MNLSLHDNPVVIIGGGRSGTTMVYEVLRAHPEFYMPAEMGFLLPRLFHCLWSEPQYLTLTKANTLLWKRDDDLSRLSWPEFVEEYRRSAELQKAAEVQLEREKNRVLEICRSTFLDVIAPPALRRDRWGFKEIWNGHPQHDYSWEIYDLLFPEAYWVHVIRSPFEFARSCAGLHSTSLTFDELKSNLANWVKINLRAEAHRSSSRYFLCRYEDLVRDPQAMIESLFEFIGLSVHPLCVEAARPIYARSPSKPPLPTGDAAEIAAIDRLNEVMERYGYGMDPFSQCAPD